MVALNREIFEAAMHQAMSNLTVALDLAQAGVYVFPCQAVGKDAKKPMPGVMWRSAATTDARRVAEWWEQFPDALVGINCEPSDFLVIDADYARGIRQWHEDVLQGRVDAAPVVRTPGGGEHRYFRRGAHRLGNGRGALPAKADDGGIDVRGAGGYVIAPGSVLPDGRRYDPGDDDILAAPPIPDWLVEILKGTRARDEAPIVRPGGIADRARAAAGAGRPMAGAGLGDGAAARVEAYGRAALDAEIARVRGCGKGGRNEALNTAAFSLGTLIGAGAITRAEVEGHLIEAARDCGLVAEDGVRACQATIRSGLEAGLRQPREIPEGGEYETFREIGAGIAASLLAGAPERVEVEDEPDEPQAVSAPVADAVELPAALANPPGLLGALTDWICDTSRRPQRSLAIGAALTILGTACGRHIAGPTGSGTHLYVVGLAPTGAGKDHALQAIGTALAAVEAPHLVGPSQFISMPAVINFLARSPLSVCCMDEFGAFMKRIGSRKASSFEGAISGILRTAWGSSGKAMATPEWAGRASEVIVGPALSIYGVSTAGEFYGALEGGDTSNGVLNRLLVVEAFGRPKDRAPKLADPDLPASLVGMLQAVLNRGGSLVFGMLSQAARLPPVYRVPWGPGAEAAYHAMVEDIYRLCDRDELAQAFYARAAEMAVRLATILAVGVDPARPVVTLEAFQWGRDFAMWSADALRRGGMDRIADNEHQSAVQLVRRSIPGAPVQIKHRDLLRKLNHRIKNRDLVEIVKALEEAGEVRLDKVKAPGGGHPTLKYTRLA